MIKDKSGLRICIKCSVHHYENCPECFGFGFNDGRIMHAGEALDYKKFGLGMSYRPMPCKFCGSTIEGLPKKVIEKQ
jgi:hypothetical protein